MLADLIHAVRQLREGFPLQTLVYSQIPIGTYLHNCRLMKWPYSNPCPDPFSLLISANDGNYRDCSTHNGFLIGTFARSWPVNAPTDETPFQMYLNHIVDAHQREKMRLFQQLFHQLMRHLCSILGTWDGLLFFIVTKKLPFDNWRSSLADAVAQSAEIGILLWPIRSMGTNCCSNFAFTVKIDERNSFVRGYK